MNKKDIKKETVEEFKARGGKVQVVPYQEPIGEKTTIYPRTPVSQDFMDLGEGELFYSEARSLAKRKETPIEALIEKLPDDIKSLVIKEFL